MLRRSDTVVSAERFTVVQAAGILIIIGLIGAFVASVLGGGAAPGSLSIRAAASPTLANGAQSPGSADVAAAGAESPVTVVSPPPDRPSSSHRHVSSPSGRAGVATSSPVRTRSSAPPATQSRTVAPAGDRGAKSIDVQSAARSPQRTTGGRDSAVAATRVAAAFAASEAATPQPVVPSTASIRVARPSGGDAVPSGGDAVPYAAVPYDAGSGVPAGPSLESAQGNVLSDTAQAAEQALVSDTTGAALTPYMQAGVTPSSVIGVNALSSALPVATMQALGFTKATDPAGATFWVGPNVIGNPAFKPVSGDTDPAPGTNP